MRSTTQPVQPDPGAVARTVEPVFVPFFVGSGALLVLATGDARAAWLPVAFLYLVVPLLDWALGEDRSNPPESAVPALEADRYYRWVTYAGVPTLWITFVASVWLLATQDLPLHAQIATVLSAGLAGGSGGGSCLTGRSSMKSDPRVAGITPSRLARFAARAAAASGDGRNLDLLGGGGMS